MKKLLFLTIGMFLLSPYGVAHSQLSVLEFTEEDAAPSTTPVIVKVPNGTLTDNGDDTASLAYAGAPSGGVFASSSVPFGDGTASLIEDNPGITYLPGTGLSLDDALRVKGAGRFDSGLQDGFSVLGVNTESRELVASDGTDIVLVWATAGTAQFGNSLITTTGTFASGVATITGVINTSVGLDGVGAVDLDYGSAELCPSKSMNCWSTSF